MMSRPFKVLGVQQIAIGGPDKTRLQKLWVDMFGLEQKDFVDTVEGIITVGDFYGLAAGGQIIKVAKIRTMYVGSDRKRDEVIGAPDGEILDRYRDHSRRFEAAAARRSTRPGRHPEGGRAGHRVRPGRRPGAPGRHRPG